MGPPNQSAIECETGSPIEASDDFTTAPVRLPAGTDRRDSIRLRLGFLVVACVLPVWIAAGFLIYYNYQSKRALTEQRMLETARALTMVVDRELANMQASLSVLATTPSLASGDLPAFYRQARMVLEAHPDAYIVLADATGQLLINTFQPIWGAIAQAQRRRMQFAKSMRPASHLSPTSSRGCRPGAFRSVWTFPCSATVESIYDLAMTVPVDRFVTSSFAAAYSAGMGGQNLRRQSSQCCPDPLGRSSLPAATPALFWGSG